MPDSKQQQFLETKLPSMDGFLCANNLEDLRCDRRYQRRKGQCQVQQKFEDESEVHL